MLKIEQGLEEPGSRVLVKVRQEQVLLRVDCLSPDSILANSKLSPGILGLPRRGRALLKKDFERFRKLGPDPQVNLDEEEANQSVCEGR